MANEMVNYQNDLNAITMRKWTVKEMDILFAVIAKIRERSTNEITFSFGQLKELTQFKKNITKQEFIDELDKITDKILDLKVKINSPGRTSKYNLFQTFDTFENEEQLVVAVHPKFEYIFNRIGMEFTQFELQEFIGVSSTYSKSLYRLLKQYRTTGWWKVTIEDFKELLDVPKSYKSSHIDQKILNPAIKQLGGSDEHALFKNLKVTKNKKKGRGGVLTGYTFTFQAEKTDDWVEGKFKKQQPQTRKETLPEWVGKELTETPMAEEEQAKLRQQLAEMRSKNPNIKEKHP